MSYRPCCHTYLSMLWSAYMPQPPPLLALQTWGVSSWWTGMSAEVLCGHTGCNAHCFVTWGKKIRVKKTVVWVNSQRERRNGPGRANGWDLKRMEEKVSNHLRKFPAAGRKHVCSVFHAVAYVFLFFLGCSFPLQLGQRTPRSVPGVAPMNNNCTLFVFFHRERDYSTATVWQHKTYVRVFCSQAD